MTRLLSALLIQMLFLTSLQSQDQYDAFVQEIGKLAGVEQVSNYWKSIRSADQAYRGVDAVDSNDCANMVKAIALIEKFGYPDPKIFDRKIAFTPVIVFAHQNSIEAGDLCFPYLFGAYKDSLLDLDDMMYFLEGFHHSKYGQYFERNSGPHDYTIPEMMRLIAALELDTVVTRKTSIIALFRQEKAEQKNDRSLKVLGRWNQSKDDIYICYTKGNCSYLKLLHADHSYSRPQVKFRKENDTTIIEYAHSFYGDYFKINKAGNLEYYKSGVFSKEYPKTL